MVTRFVTASVLALFVSCSFGCSKAETPDTKLDGVDVSQTRLIDILQANHPELYTDIAVQGATPDDAALLFLVNKGGTYVLRRGAGQMPEIVHHAKIIAPNSITSITYKDRAFMLWSGDKLQLTLAGYP